MANRIVSIHAGIYGMEIYAIMVPSSGFSVAHSSIPETLDASADEGFTLGGAGLASTARLAPSGGRRAGLRSALACVDSAVSCSAYMSTKN